MRKTYISVLAVAASFFALSQIVDLSAAVSRLKTWSAGETLTASDLNAEFNNIVNNGEDVGWPATKAKDLDANQLILDGDQDSHITSDTDDRIDFSVGGFDGVRFDGTTASSVNGFDFQTQSTGVNPQIEAQGESNIGIEFQDSNGNELAVFDSVASAVNEVQITNAATGNPPLIDAQGEANTGLHLRDSNNNEVLILGSTASAVNEITVTNAATGNDPVISTSGEANVGLTITPAGTGDTTISTGDLTLTAGDLFVSEGDGTLTSTDAGATANPLLVLYRNSASPAVADAMGQINFNGRNDAPEDITYGSVLGVILDETDATEDGAVDIRTIIAGSSAVRARFQNGLFMNGATGGDKGTGTINAQAVYDDGSQIHALQDGLGTVTDLTNSGADDTSAWDYTGIASDARRITIMFEDASLSGTDEIIVVLGDSGGFELTGYQGKVSAGGGATTNFSVEFQLLSSGVAAGGYHGVVELVLLNSSTNTWALRGSLGRDDDTTIGVEISAGTKSLSGTLTQIRIGVTGTDTFDGGNANILVE